MAVYSLMGVRIRYPGIKQDCTDITSATQGMMAEEWNNSETLVQELCPDNSYGPRSHCHDLSAVMNGGFPLAWELVRSSGHTNTHKKIAETKWVFIFKGSWRWPSSWGFIGFLFYDDALWSCTFSPKLPQHSESLHIDDSVLLFVFILYFKISSAHSIRKKSLYWVIPDLCSNIVS